MTCPVSFLFYLTIRLRARDFYSVIVDEGEARINYHRIEVESKYSNCFSRIRGQTWNIQQKFDF